MDVIERFLKYVRYDTQSDDLSETSPSSAKQKILGKELARELSEMGLSDVRFDEFGYVYGFLPAGEGCENLPVLGFISHMDTSPDASGANVNPKMIRYEGGDVVLENGEKIDLASFPTLSRYQGQDLIVTDGKTLLGADDKAGVAEIFSACEYLLAHPEVKHGRIAVAVTPDEEVGRGSDHFDLDYFGAEFAYTVDGDEIGEIEYENFNAASAALTVHGVNIHPGSAKGRMKNAILMANEFVSMLPAKETPAHTEGYEGFFHVHDFAGDETTASVRLLIRDHDFEKFTARKELLEGITAALNEKWGSGSFAIEIKDSYYNMKEKILPHMELIENAKNAMRACGVEPRVVPIRGGTDGARLSYMGLPCPNLSTGGTNFHGVHEYIPVNSMKTMVNVIVELMKAKG